MATSDINSDVMMNIGAVKSLLNSSECFINAHVSTNDCGMIIFQKNICM